MADKRQKLNTYLKVDGFVYRRHPVIYTKNQKKKITSYFLKNKSAALKETSDYLSEFIGRLKSSITSTSIKRKGVYEEIIELRAQFKALENLLRSHVTSPSRDSTIRYKKALYPALDRMYHSMKLNGLYELVREARLACEVALKTCDIPGVKNPLYHLVIQNLALVWEKYAHKKPTRHSIEYTLSPAQTSQRAGGPFLEYMHASIDPALRQAKIRPEISLDNVARDVMAKIS